MERREAEVFTVTSTGELRGHKVSLACEPWNESNVHKAIEEVRPSRNDILIAQRTARLPAVKRMAAGGASAHEMCNALNITRNQLSRDLRDLGVKLPRGMKPKKRRVSA